MALFIVSNLDDSGAGSLRDAVEQANLSAGADTITFSVAGTIVLTSNQLELTDDVTIDGDITNDGKADITISGNDANRIFDITGANADVALQSLTLTNGGTGSAIGGAIKIGAGANQTLKVTDTTIQNSTALYGGAIYSSGGAKVSLNNSLIYNNTATHENFGGAGLYAFGGSLSISNSTITNNVANSTGGGIAAGNGTIVTISNSTIYKNYADDNGGNATDGGGIINNGATFKLTNTVVAENYSGGTINDVNGTIATATNSVFGTAVTITTSTNNQLNVADVGLKPLHDNGGTTQTQNINPDSVLINAGTNTGTPATDANGGPRNVAGTVDVGATEFKLVVTTLQDNMDANDGQLSLREAVALANAGAGADVITFANGLFGTIALGTQLSLTSDVTIDGDTNGDNKADISLGGGGTNRIFFQSGETTDVTLLSLTLQDGRSGNSHGGAIYAYNSGSLVIQDSTLQNNSANYKGGAIYANQTDLSLSSSLLLNNSAGKGGALYIDGFGLSTTTVVNSTLQGNTASDKGGAIYVDRQNTLNLTNSTVTENRGYGGGVYIYQSGSTVNITNSVVAGNLNAAGTTANDLAGAGNIDTATHSVFGTTVSITTNTNSLQNVTNLGLGTLGDHGGTTQTLEIINANSPLLNAGSNAGAAGIVTDANGNPRIQEGTVDIGAAESNLILVTNLNDSGEGSLRDAVTKANATDGLDHIVFQQGLTGTIALSSKLGLYDQVTINGDTNGNGDADITLTTTGNLGTSTLLVDTGVTADLTSLNFSGITNTAAGSAGIIQNNGSLTLSYSVMSGNTLTGTTGGPSQDGSSASPVVNTGTMVVNQSVFAGNAANGGNGGAVSFPSTGRAGGDASASIINAAGAMLTTTALALISGSATGGNGSGGANALPGLPETGRAGGNGGNASIGVLNLGTANGTYGGDNNGVAIGGLGGAGGAGSGGGLPGAQGANGQSYYGNLNLGTGVLNFVNTGNQFADSVNFGSAAIFYGLGGNDSITSKFASQLFGGSGHDTLSSYGNSTVRGGLGNDVLRNNKLGNDYGSGIWDGGVGIDTFDASTSVSDFGIYIDLSTGVTNVSGTVLNIENIIGTNNAALNDNLTGNGLANDISGLLGTDTILGLGGNDMLSGGAGGDHLDGGEGSDTADYRTSAAGTVNINLLSDTASGGEAAGDTLDSIENLLGSLTLRDILVGDTNANTIYGFGGADSLRGGGGDDFLEGGAGGDAINGDAGTSDTASYRDSNTGTVNINLLTNTYSGGDAQGDTLFFIENLEGSLIRRDILVGNNIINRIFGNGGIDSIRGEGGNDFIDGGAGGDSLNAGGGIDTLSYEKSSAGVTIDLNIAAQTSGGDASGDVLNFFENVNGSAFADSIRGNYQANRLVGGNGVDTLDGGTGSDYLTGGADADTFRFTDIGFGTDQILDWQDGIDEISIALPLETNFNGLSFTNNGTTSVTVKGFNGGGAIIVHSDAAFTLDVSDFVFV